MSALDEYAELFDLLTPGEWHKLRDIANAIIPEDDHVIGSVKKYLGVLIVSEFVERRWADESYRITPKGEQAREVLAALQRRPTPDSKG